MAANAKNAKNIASACKNEVAMDGVIKEQVAMEENTSKVWNCKWGFMKDFDKISVRVAANLGISQEEYRRMTQKKAREAKPSDTDELERKCQPSGPVPITSSAFVGWRAKNPENILDKYGPLYISPRHTMDPPGENKLPITQIILG